MAGGLVDGDCETVAGTWTKRVPLRLIEPQSLYKGWSLCYDLVYATRS